MGQRQVHAVIYKDGESAEWVAECLEFGVTTQGDSEEHALKMIQEAVELHLEDMTFEQVEEHYIPVGSEPVIRKFSIRAPALLDR